MRKNFALLLLCLASIPPVQAQNETRTRYYDVELIVFERNDAAAAEREFWPAVTQRPGSGVSLAGSGFLPLGYGQRVLNGVYSTLARSPAYTPLAHISWRQPGLSAARARAVRIRAGQAFELSVEASEATPAPPKSGQLYPLEGTVKVVLGRYLHVYADLLLRRRMPEGFAGENQIGGRVMETPLDDGAGFQGPALHVHEFQLRQHRRMRSGEMHYLDHPMMGMIVIIRRA